jgi:N-acetyl-gamma-glutamyl-phosphate reductase
MYNISYVDPQGQRAGDVMLHVAIAGVTGYSGEELLRMLLQHPHVAVTYVAGSARFERAVPLEDLYGDLVGTGLHCEAFDAARAAEMAEVCFLALPHGHAMQHAPALLKRGRRVVDLSGDFRLLDPSAYPKWYGIKHASPALLAEAVYGLTEYCREEIRDATLIANPGCYATATLLGLLPLVRQRSTRVPVIVDAKSGFSGAGRAVANTYAGDEAGNLRPYKVLGQHQHLPEILQAAERITQQDVDLFLTPHIVPAERGLLCAIYAQLEGAVDAAVVWENCLSAYRNEPLVDVLKDEMPGFSTVRHTNRCAIGVRTVDRTVLVVSAIDNLRKGAASQAVQNMNLMCGFDDLAGLSV